LDLLQEPEHAYKRYLPEAHHSTNLVSITPVARKAAWRARPTQGFQIIDFKAFPFFSKTRDRVAKNCLKKIVD
jgi:hypothetical protein